ncbi:MAG: hypothetical protein IE933_11140 [Sphingomonadales bacterium]|nr:hypothetical protein [Sphingomonadales bacterium]MBD3774379.1 hypothetical protein [Paracoccaceae bacterium]
MISRLPSRLAPPAAAVAALALLLASCGDKAPAPQADSAKGAEGEVLGGTISDEMIPLDEIRSQSAPVKPSDLPPSQGGPTAAASGDAADKAGDAAGQPATAPAAADAPVAQEAAE